MKYFKLILIAAFLFRVAIAFNFWHPDLNNHLDWGVRFFEYGTKKFYAPESNVWSFTWPNQPPGTMYMFAAVRKVFEITFAGFWFLNVKIPAFPSIVISFFETNLYPFLLHLPAIFADFGIGYLIYKITNKKWAFTLWVINPVVWYNSSFWGQYDSVINFFALLSFYLLTKRKLTLSVLAFALSVYIKASLLIFAPILLILLLKQKYKITEYLSALLYTLAVIVLLTVPFSKGNTLIWLYNLYVEKIFVQQLHIITANAFNLWAFIAGIHERPDSLPFLGLTYQLWGTILYALSYIPLVWSVYKKPEIKNIVWVLSLVAFSSFTLLTNMHERYLYPLLPYLTILIGMSEVKSWIYWVINIVSLLNLYNFWFNPRIDLIVNFLSFGDRLMPRVLGLLVFGLFTYLYSKHLRQQKLLRL